VVYDLASARWLHRPSDPDIRSYDRVHCTKSTKSIDCPGHQAIPKNLFPLENLDVLFLGFRNFALIVEVFR